MVMIAILVIALAVRLAFFVGFTGSDDAHYANRGLLASMGQWPASDYVGDLRLGMTLPLAALVAVFGPDEWAVALWGLACSLAEIALVGCLVWRLGGQRAGALAALLLALVPVHAYLATNLWADAPYAFMQTAAVATLWLAIRKQQRAWLVASGLALGFVGWIKPEPAVVFGLVYAALALAFYPARRQLLWVLGAAAFTVVLNLGLFQLTYGDPLYYVKTGSRNIQENFVQNEAPWGDHSASFYAQLMFRDGRAFWLLPLLSVVGLVSVWRAPLQPHAGRFMAAWTLLLLLAFSLFPYSMSPWRFIPKQVNYALMFAAPLACLAGIWLARQRGVFVAAVLSLMAVGGLALLAVSASQAHLKRAVNEVVLEFSRQHPQAVVLANLESVMLNEWSRVAGEPFAPGLTAMGAFSAGQRAAVAGRQVFLLSHPDWPEYQGKVRPPLLDSVNESCMEPVSSVAALPPENLARVVSRGLVPIRDAMPEVLARQLMFIDRSLTSSPVRVATVRLDCLQFASN